MPSLTRIEAENRAALLTVDSYHVSLDLRTPDDPHFASTTVIRFGCRQRDAATFLDIKADSVSSVVLNGRSLDADEIVDGRLRLTGLADLNELTLVAQMSYSSDGEGLHRHTDPADGEIYLYAMSFLDAGPRWFANFDQPDLKARYELDVLCPERWTVIGNGPATELAPGHWHLAPTKPLSTYFVTLVAGPYHSVRSEHDGITLGLHARASLAQYLEAESAEMLSVTRNAFDRYHELFGIRYPFGEYHQAFVPDFNAGAMENPGCVTFRDQFIFRSATTKGERGVRANTIVHEMAHMWFGDLVTMRWWDDLWLNESFAEYMAHRVCSETTGYAAWTEFGIRRKDWGYVADQAPSTHPVAGNGAPDAMAALADFDGISYAKGASVLKQLATYLGDEIFFGGLRSYFTQHSYGNAEFSNLIAAWTEAGAQGLEQWANQWLRTSGLDTITASVTTDSIEISRTSPDESHRPHAIQIGGFDSDGRSVSNTPIILDVDTPDPLRIPSSAGLAVAIADSADATWAKIRFGTDGFANLARVLPRLHDAQTRVVAYNAVRDAVRDAELDPAQALQILLTSSESEEHEFVVAALLGFAADQLCGPYCPVPERRTRLSAVNSVATRLLAVAEPGADTQLVAARAVIRTSTEEPVLRGWLEGTGLPAGLVVDAELRWALVERLATLGAADEDAIAAELDRDRSTSGVVHAAKAHALRPDPAAKASAWKLLTEPGTTPAYELYATAEGFFEGGQTEVTAEYVPRFFTDMPATAQHRHGWALARIVLLGYPVTSSTEPTLALARHTLDRTDLDSGVRRSLVDGTNVLSRAVASIRRYGSR